MNQYALFNTFVMTFESLRKTKIFSKTRNVNEHTAKNVSPTTKYLDPKQKNFNMATFDKYLHRQENNSN